MEEQEVYVVKVEGDAPVEGQSPAAVIDLELMSDFERTLWQMAGELETLYMRRADLAVDMAACEAALAQRQLGMTPVAGWPGKNADERNAVREATFLADEALRQMMGDQQRLRNDLTLAQAGIDGAEARRRALEWIIRLREAAGE